MRRTTKPGEIKQKKRRKISHGAATSKGRELQKWVCGLIAGITGFEHGKDKPIESRPGRQSGTDVRMEQRVLDVFPFSVECKRQETLAIPSWIKQAKANMIPDTDWLLISRKSNERAIVIMDAEAFFNLCKRKKE